MSISTSGGYDEKELLRLIQVPHKNNNITQTICERVGRRLHLQKHHPLCIIKNKIESYCQTYAIDNKQSNFTVFDDIR